MANLTNMAAIKIILCFSVGSIPIPPILKSRIGIKIQLTKSIQLPIPSRVSHGPGIENWESIPVLRMG